MQIFAGDFGPGACPWKVFSDDVQHLQKLFTFINLKELRMFETFLYH